MITFTGQGKVVRSFSSDKFGKVTLEVAGERNACKLDFKTFNADHIALIKTLKPGDSVEVTGSIGVEAVKDKAKVDIEVDGYKLWIPMLKMETINGVTTGTQAVGPDKTDAIPF